MTDRRLVLALTIAAPCSSGPYVVEAGTTAANGWLRDPRKLSAEEAEVLARLEDAIRTAETGREARRRRLAERRKVERKRARAARRRNR